MKALVLEQAGPDPLLTVADLPPPSVGDFDALVQIAACGFCHHDLLVMNGTLRRGVQTPLIPGHEVAGVVTEVGRRVTTVRPETPSSASSPTPADGAAGAPRTWSASVRMPKPSATA